MARAGAGAPGGHADGPLPRHADRPLPRHADRPLPGRTMPAPGRTITARGAPRAPVRDAPFPPVRDAPPPPVRRAAPAPLARAAPAPATRAAPAPVRPTASARPTPTPAPRGEQRARSTRPVGAFPDPPPVRSHGPARVLAVCNQKGGVGKTTTAINLGAALAETGRRVLLVDLDPQGALSVGLGINAMELERTVYDLMTSRDAGVHDVRISTEVAGLDLLPANIDLSAADVELVGEVAREHTLARVLAPVLPEYDQVLIDCQPSLGPLTVNALTAAHGVLVPLECEYFALRGVALLMQTIEKVRERLNPGLAVEGILATLYDGRTVHSREVLARVVETFGDQVFATVVQRTVRFPETTVAGEPITTYDSASGGAAAYRQLARELLAR